MTSATLRPFRPHFSDTVVDEARGRPSGPHSPARILRTTEIDEALRLSHLTSRKGEWFAVHRVECSPDVVADRSPDNLGPRTVAIVVLTATDEEQSRLVGELPAHIGAVLRGRPAPEQSVIDVQELHIDADAHRVTVAGREVSLTRLQFKLLVALVERKDRVQSRGVLLAEVWGIVEPIHTRTVDTHVKRLRDKLGGAGRFIQCVRGVGYLFSTVPWKAQGSGCGAAGVRAVDTETPHAPSEACGE